jgi:predicted Rossmann fold flavoprotein
MAIKVLVVGGGASGMMAAARAAEHGARVSLLEKMPRLGSKILLAGKGRCNFSNTADLREFIAAFGPEGKFLYGAFSQFFRPDLLDLFERLGLKAEVERGGRIFPASNRALDVLRALKRYLQQGKVKVELRSPVDQVEVEKGRVTGVRLRGGGEIEGQACILATGGLSYPETGSSGDGYEIARRLGHTIVPLRPALVPLEVEEAWVKELQGLTLRNVKACLFSGQKEKRKLGEEFGELLFTHFGVSGPIVLRLSRLISRSQPRGRLTLSLNCKPALGPEQLDRRLIRDLAKYHRRQFKHCLVDLLPQKLVSVLVKLSGIPPERPGHSITMQERARLGNLLSALPITILRTRPIEEAVVTSGGVELAEVNPKTLESRIISGLYFCGEILNLDGPTGGYNLQAAFSTGYLAGQMAAQMR